MGSLTVAVNCEMVYVSIGLAGFRYKAREITVTRAFDFSKDCVVVHVL
jgi:hypothetical protein